MSLKWDIQQINHDKLILWLKINSTWIIFSTIFAASRAVKSAILDLHPQFHDKRSTGYTTNNITRIQSYINYLSLLCFTQAFFSPQLLERRIVSVAVYWALLVVISRAQADSACLLRYDFRANVRSQRSHLNCLSGECVCMCARRFERSANALLHSGHRKGRSPVCDLMCPCNSHGRLKAFPHTSHLWRSLCVKTCIARAGMDT